jgi:predicted secreted protein
MTPETPKQPRKPRKASEQAKVRSAVTKVIMAAEAEAKKATGRPSTYDPEIAHKICEMLSDGIPLRQICRMDGMPPWRTVYSWMARDDDLSAHIARAREIGYDAIAEECLQIADTPQLGQKQVMSDEGATTTIEDMLGHRKLQIETRLKLLAKWSNKYSDRTVITGDVNGAPIKTEDAHSSRLFELIRNMEMAKRVAD